MLRLLQKVSAKERQDERILFAIKLSEVVRAENYRKMFKMHKKAPDMVPFLIDIFQDKFRSLFLQKLAVGAF